MLGSRAQRAKVSKSEEVEVVVVVGEEGDDNDIEAEAIPVASEVPEATVSLRGTVVSQVSNRPRALISGACCCLVFIVFLVLLLLAPRAPSARVTYLDLKNETAQIEFVSRSFVKVEWRDIDFNVDWNTGGVDTITIASVSRKSKFNTKPFGEKNFILPFEDPFDENSNTLAIVCNGRGEARMRLTGSVRTDDHKLNIRMPWDFVRC